LKWGLLGGIAYATVGLSLFMLNIDSSSWISYVRIFILIAVIIAGSYEYRDKLAGGFANFKHLLGFSMKITLVYALFTSFWSIAYREFIDTELLGRMLLETEINLENRGLSDEQIDQTMDRTEKMMQAPYFFLVSVFNTALLGLLISLLSSSILRKEKPEELNVIEKLSE
jgi:hypothetical protein